MFYPVNHILIIIELPSMVLSVVARTIHSTVEWETEAVEKHPSRPRKYPLYVGGRLLQHLYTPYFTQIRQLEKQNSAWSDT